MKDIIGVLGGDLRNIELVNILRDRGYDVKTYGLSENENTSLDEFLADTKYIVGGTPFSRDGETINSTYTAEKIGVERLFCSINNNQILFAGSIGQNIKDMALRYSLEIYDFLDDEDMAILNAIPSAEGAIEVALKGMKKTLHSSNSLILGYGRIGKVLASILKGFNSNVYVVARKESDLAWIKAMGYTSLTYGELKNTISKMDVIFNTVPFLVLDEELSIVDKECVLIDLASKPGGINFTKAEELKLETYWALGLPGKVAPKSAAIYMADKIEKKIGCR